jgi:hypothetical protein
VSGTARQLSSDAKVGINSGMRKKIITFYAFSIRIHLWFRDEEKTGMPFAEKSNARFFKKQPRFFKKQPVFFRLESTLDYQAVTKRLQRTHKKALITPAISSVASGFQSDSRLK